jgi:hypothetical protein
MYNHSNNKHNPSNYYLLLKDLPFQVVLVSHVGLKITKIQRILTKYFLNIYTMYKHIDNKKAKTFLKNFNTKNPTLQHFIFNFNSYYIKIF